MADLHRLADDFKHRVHDTCDNRESPVYESLFEAAQALLDDIETKKRPESLKDRAKRIEQQVQTAKNSGAYSQGDWDDLMDRIRDIRAAI